MFRFICLTLLAMNSIALSADLQPPVAKVIPKKITVHGDTRIDNYFWLRDRSNPEVIRYLEAENRYTEAMMKHTEALQERLYKEILGRIKQTDLSVPEQMDDFYYYTRTEEGKQYPIFCRKRGTLHAAEEILLDANALAAGRKFFRIGVFKVSPNHKLLAYSTDTEGSEVYTLFVKDLETGQLLKDQIPNTYYSVEWANDNRTIFYSVLDAAKRPYQLYRHTLGADSQSDALIFHEKDDRFFLRLSKSRSREYLLLSLSSKLSSEVHYLPAGRAGAAFQVIEPRRHEVEYDVEHWGDTFFIRTNDGAKNFKLMKAPVGDPSRKNWTEVLPHRPDVMIDSVDAFRDFLVVWERRQGLRNIRVRNLRTGNEHYVDFPEPVYTVFPTGNREFHTNLLRFTYTSLVTPNSVFDYDMKSRTRQLKKRQEVLGGYDPSRCQSERVFATASDGTRIPISIVYRKGMVRNGENPLLLHAYGSYGSTREPVFDSDRLSLLDRGFVYAIAHIRGGGEMGRAWYEQGKMLNKKNTFTDFIACAEHLVKEKYTSPERLAIMGASAGGLLMGAVTNLRPDLFKAVVAKVPFVDVVNSMLDPTLPLTVTEYEEWGNPNDTKFYDYMKSYAPYESVAAKAYPHLLVTAGLNDPRVPYWEPAKWTAKLRALKTDKNRLLLKTNMGAGHGGASGRYDRMKDTAFEYAFILDVMGITN